MRKQTPSNAAETHAPAGAGRRADAWPARVPILPLWLILCFAACYLLPGSIGHEPWKQDETYTFGIIDHMRRTGDWLVPTNAGQPFMEKPPIYSWVAVALVHLLGPWLPAHDAARLASVLFMLVGFAAALRLASRAYGCHWRALPSLAVAALMAGSVLVLKHSHDLFTDVALLAGASLACCGLHGIVADMRDGRARARTADVVLFGVGVGLAHLAKGVFLPAVFLLATLLQIVWHPECRRASYVGAVAWAVAVCAPFLLIWPALLEQRSHALFMAWFWDNNVGRFLGFSVPQLGSDNERGFVFKALLLGTFPLGLLAVLGAARITVTERRRWRAPHLSIALSLTAIGLALLIESATARQLYLLPFALPLALLAAEAMPARLGRTWAAVDWSLRLVFAGLAGLVWYLWWVMRAPVDGARGGPVAMLGKWLPLDYVLPAQGVAIVAACALSAGWLVAMAWLPRVGRWRALLSWLCGLTLIWGLVGTLLLPWLDRAKSYGPVWRDLAQHIAPVWRDGDCMASIDLGEGEAPMLYYFADILHQPVDRPDRTNCRWLLTQGRAHAAEADPRAWAAFWHGARQGDRDEWLEVFERRPDAGRATTSGQRR
ncbi:ArnT family glycosyltransferase [Chitinasiproducens palmae]|uniref:4-amino-4-deoxy-L-arabinose transferase n=1 Tax=Chitinasiproducens palmae TaxID=1770053 RepID=A0A1H2PUW2_9BURK|nr:glycosyl transferase [Chitinasiproducens palmae]SDV51004.1 4-amino-4-deoxy-L-arabinose transferase [Chitinasiproducens palmae]